MADQADTTVSTETPSIEAIAAEFNLTQETTPAQDPTPQPATKPAPAATPAPDPVTNPDDFKAWLSTQTQQTAELQTNLSDTLKDIASEKQRLAAQREEQETNALVDKLHGEIGGDVAKSYVKYALVDRYQTDAAFKAIWDNRGTSPQALERAQAALVSDLKDQFRIKADPQIAENQRAMSDGTSGSSTTTVDPDSKDLSLLRAPQAEFEQNWEKIKMGP